MNKTQRSEMLYAGFLSILAAAVIIGIVVLAARRAPARELYPGQHAQVPDNIRSWFKGVRSPRGIPCCDIADGHKTTWRHGTQTEQDSGYEVPILVETAGEQASPDDVDAVPPKSITVWLPVPKVAVVHNAGNPLDEAVVWYVRQGNDLYYIRCFVPGDGV